MARLGVGPKPIAQKDLTVQRFAAAIREATGDERLKARAAALGAGLRAENRVQVATEIIGRA